MQEQLEQLEARVTELVERYSALRTKLEKSNQENLELKTELASLKQESDAFRLISKDQARQVKTKLGTVLGRIEELESLNL